MESTRHRGHIVELQRQIALLQGEMAELRADVAVLKECTEYPVFANEPDEFQEKKKPGQKVRLSRDELFHDRDALILWLERNWPSLEGRFLEAKSPQQMRAVFEMVAEKVSNRTPYQQRFLDNAKRLLEFRFHQKFRKTLPKTLVARAINGLDNPRQWRAANQLPTRQIANAMAGVPIYKWETSLDLCSRKPSQAKVAEELETYYRGKYSIEPPGQAAKRKSFPRHSRRPGNGSSYSDRAGRMI